MLFVLNFSKINSKLKSNSPTHRMKKLFVFLVCSLFVKVSCFAEEKLDCSCDAKEPKWKPWKNKTDFFPKGRIINGENFLFHCAQLIV